MHLKTRLPLASYFGFLPFPTRQDSSLRQSFFFVLYLHTCFLFLHFLALLLYLQCFFLSHFFLDLLARAQSDMHLCDPKTHLHRLFLLHFFSDASAARPQPFLGLRGAGVGAAEGADQPSQTSGQARATSAAPHCATRSAQLLLKRAAASASLFAR